jgi:hypothetical protein
MLGPEDFVWLTLRQLGIESGDELPLDVEVLNDLADALINTAEFLEGTEDGAYLQNFPAAPGYLTAKIGEWHVFVPWSITQAFPGTSKVAELLRMGDRVALRSAGNLCVSGSVTSAGADVVIGDLDFCQYVDGLPGGFIAEAEEFTRPQLERILTVARYGRTTVVRQPWATNWPALEKRAGSCTHVDDAERFMMEFLGHSDDLGLLPVSNIVFASDLQDRSVGVADQSFVFQEAIAVRSTDLPAEPIWPLLDVPQIASYISFLRKQASEYAEENPIKAIKRAFSLTRMVGLHAFATEALHILKARESVEYVVGRREWEVAQIWARLDPADRDVLKAAGHSPVTEAATPPNRLGGELSERVRDFLERLNAEWRRMELKALQQ